MEKPGIHFIPPLKKLLQDLDNLDFLASLQPLWFWPTCCRQNKTHTHASYHPGPLTHLRFWTLPQWLGQAESHITLIHKPTALKMSN